VAAVKIDADLIIVRTQQALRDMEAYLLSGDRGQPVVGLTCLPEINEPVLAPERVRAIVGAGPQIYYVPGDHLLRCLHGVLGRRLALPAGGVRVWWPGLTARSDPGEHPFVLALDSEPQGDLLAEFACQFELSRPFVRSEIKVIEDARRLAEHELSQALEQNRSMRVERDQALTRAQEAERALEAATHRLRDLGCEERP